MTAEQAHEILEQKQRIMTENRYLYTEEVIKANGLAILALEEQIKRKNTNFGKITVLPETLAKFVIFENISCESVWCRGRYCEEVDGNCQRCLSAWLKQEAEDEDDV